MSITLEPAFAQDVYPASIFKRELLHEVANLTTPLGHLRQGVQIYFHVEVAGVGHNGSVFHHFKVFLPQDMDVPGESAEEVADTGGGIHGQNLVDVHDGLEGSQGVHFRDNDLGTHSRGPHGDSTPTPTIAAHHEVGTGNEPVGGPDDPVDGALPRAVPVVEEMLRVRIVHGDDRVLEDSLFRHAPQADHAGGGFLGAADDAFDELFALRVDGAHQIRSVVHGHVGSVGKGGMDVAIVGFLVFSLHGKNGDVVVFGQGCGDVVLGAQGIGGAKAHVGTSGFEGLSQCGRLRRHMEAGGDTEPFEGFLASESFLDGAQYWHGLGSPFDPQSAFVCQSFVFYVKFHEISSWCCRRSD
jgi:hypothetical protein